MWHSKQRMGSSLKNGKIRTTAGLSYLVIPVYCCGSVCELGLVHNLKVAYFLRYLWITLNNTLFFPPRFF